MSNSLRLHDCSPPGSSVHGIFQAKILEWAAISFSNAWKWKVKVKSLSRAQLFATPWTAAYQAPPSMGFSRQEYWSGLPLPSLYEARTTLMPKLYKDIKRELQFNIFYEHRCKNIHQNISKLNLVMYKKNYTAQLNGICPRYARLIKLSKTNG